MKTTVRISKELARKLHSMKIDEDDTYEGVIWGLVEDRMEFSEETKRNIEQSRREMAAGKTISFEEVKRKLGLLN